MKLHWEHLVGLLALGMLAYGCWLGLAVAPPDRFMGDTQRIMYVHVPSAMGAGVALSLAFLAAIGWLATKGRWAIDAAMEASIEVGVLFSALLTVQGSLWARPTWGVWWDWDPRLTTTAILVLAFGAVLAMRSFVDDPTRRATWTAVATIIAFVDVPIVYFSVRWWRSLHQTQSNTGTMDASMLQPLFINLAGMTLLTVWFIVRRWRVARAHRAAELAELGVA
jgi:heme exporter protein C